MPILLRVDDVGRTPNDLPESGSDFNCEYFAEWYRQFDLGDLPAVFAAVPTWIREGGQETLRKTIGGRQSMAVHGWDHQPGGIVTSTQMNLGISALKTTNRVESYVPPFNEYGDREIGEWSKTGKRYFFGGFPGRHHSYPHFPVELSPGGIIHIPAVEELYGRAGELSERAEKWRSNPCPVVMTLHVPWDAKVMSALPKLRDAIASDLIGFEELEVWIENTRLRLDALTAPHYLAYSWICERLPAWGKVLDFGCRNSILPSQMALRGCDVTCLDRDPDYPNAQHANANRFGVKLTCESELSLSKKKNYFDAITACWSIQHNPEAKQTAIVEDLSYSLKPGGKMLIVSSFTPGLSFEQTARKDPQRVLSWGDHYRVIIDPSRCRLESWNTFRYEHGSEVGDWCRPDQANAVVYELRKV